MSISQILYGICILLTGLLTGLFYGYQCSVNNGLGTLGNKEYLLGFQSINKAILNPVFFTSFLGSLIILAITTLYSFINTDSGLFPYLLSATLIYAIGVVGITVVCNVPLNEMLAGCNLHSASIEQLQEIRTQFEVPWNRWHLIRTIASVIAFLVLVFPLLRRI